ncbi:MAG: hypothetical protein WDO70_10110 [Alphaproteobacteria bacterium]
MTIDKDSRCAGKIDVLINLAADPESSTHQRHTACYGLGAFAGLGSVKAAAAITQITKVYPSTQDFSTNGQGLIPLFAAMFDTKAASMEREAAAYGLGAYAALGNDRALKALLLVTGNEELNPTIRAYAIDALHVADSQTSWARLVPEQPSRAVRAVGLPAYEG